MSLIVTSNQQVNYSQRYSTNMYRSIGFGIYVWRFSSNDYPTLTGEKFVEGGDLLITSNSQVPFTGGKAKKTYLDATFDMERIWYINELADYPRLVYRARADLGTPLTHNMNYFYVVPHIEGTMNFKNLTWKSKGAFFSFPSPAMKGVLNQEVTYSIPDQDLTQRITHKDDGTVDLKWFASGVRDILGAGGFGTYNEERTRTIKVGNVASATVNFYFTQPQWIPKVNYKLSVSTPDGIVDVMVTSKYEPTRFAVMPGVIISLPLVEPNDEKATAIHVMTDSGIKSLEAYVEYENIEMQED